MITFFCLYLVLIHKYINTFDIFKFNNKNNSYFSSVNHIEDIQLSPGCLYHANDDGCVQTYEYMINKSHKEVMFDLYNKLSKIDVQKSPSPKSLLKVTPQSVEKIVTASKGRLSRLFSCILGFDIYFSIKMFILGDHFHIYCLVLFD